MRGCVLPSDTVHALRFTQVLLECWAQHAPDDCPLLCVGVCGCDPSKLRAKAEFRNPHRMALDGSHTPAKLTLAIEIDHPCGDADAWRQKLVPLIGQAIRQVRVYALPPEQRP